MNRISVALDKMPTGSKAAKRSQISKGLSRASRRKKENEKAVAKGQSPKFAKNRSGRLVSKSRSALGKKSFKDNLEMWSVAVKRARKDLKLQGFTPVGGRTAAGKELYELAKQHRREM